MDQTRVDEIVTQVLGLPPEERSSFIEKACGDDATLREAVTQALTIEQQAAPVDFRPGEDIGVYRILEPIGEGGMGTVFLAEQREPVERRVALKVVKLGMDTKEVLARFEAERQALALMSHPNVAAVYDASATASGRPYFAMEYVPGVPITEYCDRNELTVEQRVRLFIQACHGVQHAHQKGLIHRDLKPTNILVTEKTGEPIVKIIDFGVAKSTQKKLTARTLHTQLGVFIGTPDYTSPEQAGRDAMDVDTRTDVYALGVVLYEILAGKRPFERSQFNGKSISEIQELIRQVEPPTLGTRFAELRNGSETIADRRSASPSQLHRKLKKDLSWVVARAMEKERNNRYPSASALAADLKRFLNGVPVEARAHTPYYRMKKFILRHRAGVTLGVVLLIGMVSITFGSLQLYLDAEHARRAAENAMLVARQEQATTSNVTEFLVKLFEAADPWEPARQRYADITAEDMLERGVEKLQEAEDLDPEVRARLLSTLGGIVYADDGGGPGSLSRDLIRQAHAIWQGLRNANDPDYALSLAYFARIQDDPREKIRLLKESLGIMLQPAPPSASFQDIQKVRNWLGDAYYREGRYDEAKGVFLEILAAQQAAEYGDNVRLSSALNNVAMIHHELGQYAAAKQYYEQAIDTMEMAGEVSPYTANMLSNLGQLYLELDDYDKAETLFSDALEMRLAVFGEDHHLIASSYQVLAELRAARHDPKAEEMFLKAIDLRQRLSPASPRLGRLLWSFGSFLLSSGRLEEARRTFDRGLALMEQVRPDGHENTALLLTDLASIDRRHGELELARRRLESAQQMIQDRRSTPGPLMMSIIYELGAVSSHEGNEQESLDLLRQCLESEQYSPVLERIVEDYAPLAEDPDFKQLTDPLASASEDLQRVRD